ncbi:Hpt domain-containing protein [Pararhodobacter oceanensis]|uniref:Hpt domain-containing protein n=1 Tax=Pararhodobacter oceanensis TaxID=2172121 RepID=UPI003A939C25
MNDQTRSNSGPDGSQESDPAAIDPAVLDRLLSMGDEAMRSALCAQMISDFQRLGAAIDDPDITKVAHGAHEMKGLAATIGAARLATMARSLDTVAKSLGAAAASALVGSTQSEVARVIAVLSDAAEDSSPA